MTHHAWPHSHHTLGCYQFTPAVSSWYVKLHKAHHLTSKSCQLQHQDDSYCVQACHTSVSSSHAVAYSWGTIRHFLTIYHPSDLDYVISITSPVIKLVTPTSTAVMLLQYPGGTIRCFLTRLGLLAPLGLPNNSIRTAKYTVLSFLPVNLFQQFTRVANMYFLFIAFLQLIPGLSPTSWVTTVGPLCFVLFINAIKVRKVRV